MQQQNKTRKSEKNSSGSGRCHRPFALPLSPSVFTAVVTVRLHCRCHRPFALTLSPSVCTAVVTVRLH